MQINLGNSLQKHNKTIQEHLYQEIHAVLAGTHTLILLIKTLFVYYFIDYAMVEIPLASNYFSFFMLWILFYCTRCIGTLES